MANGLLQNIANPQRISVLDSANRAQGLFGNVGAQGLRNEITGLTGQLQQSQLSGQAPERDTLERLGRIAPDIKAGFAQAFNIPVNEEARIMGFAQDVGVANRLAKDDPDAAYRYIVNRRNELQAFGQNTAKTDGIIEEFERGDIDLAVANLNAINQSLEAAGFLPTAQEKLIKTTEQGQALIQTPSGRFEARDFAGFRGEAPKQDARDDFTLSKGQVRFGPNGEIIARVASDKGGSAAAKARAKPPTDAQNISAGFANRMIDANQILTQLDNSAEFDSSSRLERLRGLTGETASENFQLMEQARSNFVTAVLRKESGAVISEQEFERKARELFAQPGDSEKVIKQKIKSRQREIQSMVRNSGPAFNIEVQAPGVATPQVQQVGRFQVEAQ